MFDTRHLGKKRGSINSKMFRTSTAVAMQYTD